MDKRELRTVLPLFKNSPATEPLVTVQEFNRWIEALYWTDHPDFAVFASSTNHPTNILDKYFKVLRPVINVNKPKYFRITSEVGKALTKYGLISAWDLTELPGVKDSGKIWVKTFMIEWVEDAMNYYLPDWGLPKIDIFDFTPKGSTEFICRREVIYETDDSIDNYKKESEVPAKVDAPRFQFREDAVNLARVTYRKDGAQVVNLRKVNVYHLNWDYISVKLYPEKKKMKVSSSTADGSITRLHKNGCSFSLSKTTLTDHFPGLEEGVYQIKEVDKTLEIDFSKKVGD